MLHSTGKLASLPTLSVCNSETNSDVGPVVNKWNIYLYVTESRLKQGIRSCSIDEVSVYKRWNQDSNGLLGPVATR